MPLLVRQQQVQTPTLFIFKPSNRQRGDVHGNVISMNSKHLLLDAVAIFISCICLCACNGKPQILNSKQMTIHGKTFDFTEYKDGYKGVSLDGEDVLYGKYDSLIYVNYSDEFPGLFVAKSPKGTIDIANEQGIRTPDNEYVSAKVQAVYETASNEGKYSNTLVVLKSQNGTYNIAEVNDLKPFLKQEYNNVTIKSNGYEDNNGDYKYLSYLELTDDSGKKAFCSIDGSATSPFINFESSHINSTSTPYSNNKYDNVHEPYISVSKNSQHGVIELDGTVAVPVSFAKVFPDLNGYKNGPVNFYWIAEAPDGTQVLYYKGEALVPSGTFTGVGVQYDQDRYPWISASIDLEEGWAEAAYSIEGAMVIPPLKNCGISHKDGNFKIFSYDDHRRERYDEGYSWDELMEMYTESYSKAKHGKYEYKGFQQASSSEKRSKGSASSSDVGYESYQEWVNCYECNGTGKCHYCHGDGWDFVTNSRGEIISSQQCPVCRGSGTCQACSGNRGHYEMKIRTR